MKSIIDYLKRLNDALPLLVGTILVYGGLVLVTGIWFFDEKWKYIVGLLFGIGQAIFLSINMASCILDALGVQDKKGEAWIATKGTFRYLIVVVTTVLMCYMQWGYIGTWFVGVMGLKVSALLQPFIRDKILNRKGR